MFGNFRISCPSGHLLNLQAKLLPGCIQQINRRFVGRMKAEIARKTCTHKMSGLDEKPNWPDRLYSGFPFVPPAFPEKRYGICPFKGGVVVLGAGVLCHFIQLPNFMGRGYVLRVFDKHPSQHSAPPDHPYDIRVQIFSLPSGGEGKFN